ncbi:hypothetical protein [Aliiroseovarius crassostreae]|uniref:hypothetical protein n=1 Tax=Aliiroseovarius crassostreae TaxID=154981 RepID=UPI00220C478A|nr:hypothetical protein [Aliiroseovarius crassostreae]UWP89972.1 hypothetical protein K3J57_04585 [Aliiroseovarius crassostreae]
MQIFWQVWALAPVLLLAALFVETLYRGITSGLFLFWFWLLKHDKVSSVASLAFLPPIFGVAMGGRGWVWLGETAGPAAFGALALVVTRIILINRH